MAIKMMLDFGPMCYKPPLFTPVGFETLGELTTGSAEATVSPYWDIMLAYLSTCIFLPESDTCNLIQHSAAFKAHSAQYLVKGQNN